jgi:hypothetical protein
MQKSFVKCVAADLQLGTHLVQQIAQIAGIAVLAGGCCVQIDFVPCAQSVVLHCERCPQVRVLYSGVRLAEEQAYP